MKKVLILILTTTLLTSCCWKKKAEGYMAQRDSLQIEYNNLRETKTTVTPKANVDPEYTKPQTDEYCGTVRWFKLSGKKCIPIKKLSQQEYDKNNGKYTHFGNVYTEDEGSVECYFHINETTDDEYYN